MKKLFLITPFIPGNQTAGQHYTLQLISDLASDYSLEVCCFKYEADPLYQPSGGGVSVIRTHPISTARKIANCCKLPFLHPLFTARFDYRLALSLYRRRTEFDCFYFDFSQTFIYSLFVPGARKYLMVHDVIAQKFGRRRGWFHRMNQWLAQTTEGMLLRQSKGTILCFSDKDRHIIRELYGIEARRVDFYVGEQIRSLDYGQVEYSGSFAFFGAWSRPENLEGLNWFIDAVLPLLDGEIRFVVIGGGLNPHMREKLGGLANVAMTGFVDNPYPLLAGCAGLVAPLFQGAGVKVKVIESLACGTPVIGTGIALEGIEGVTSAGYGICCETPEEFADSIRSLMNFDMMKKLKLRESFLLHYPRYRFKELIAHDL